MIGRLRGPLTAVREPGMSEVKTLYSATPGMHRISTAEINQPENRETKHQSDTETEHVNQPETQKQNMSASLKT